jgi:tRNA pseudouridine55 synthase
MGHTWTLDPLASGLLLIATWKYTKLIPFFEKDYKTYEFKVSLDWITDSFDLWEEVKYISDEAQKKAKKEITLEQIEKIIKEKFTWKITQIPPKYSALKIDWKRAYDLAREWKDVKIKSREVEISKIKVISFSYPEVHLIATASAGTYIRSIANDLWELLWTWWYVTLLRRLEVWKLNVEDAQKLDDFIEKKSFPVEKILDNSRIFDLTENEVSELKLWKFIKKRDFMLEWNYFGFYNWKIASVIELRDDKMKAKSNF